MGSTIFTSEDAGAPMLSGVKGTLLNILKKCLTEGYGEKQPLGWTIPFEDAINNKCVFRMPAGTKTFLQIEDNSTAGYAANFCKINAFETMSNVHTGIHPAVEYNHPYSYLTKASSVNTILRKWKIVGDDRGFWLMIQKDSVFGVVGTTAASLSYILYYIGDYIPYRQEEKNVFHLGCSQIDQTFCHFYPAQSLGVSPSRLMRDLNNEKGSVFCGYGSSCSYSTTRFGNNDFLSPLAGRYLYMPITVHTLSGLLGIMPGIFHPMFKFQLNFDVSDYQEFYESDSDGITGICIPVFAYNSQTTANSQRLMITIGDNFRNAN